MFCPAILGPEVATPILWAPGKKAFFLQEKALHAHQIPRFRGGILGFGGEGEVPIRKMQSSSLFVGLIF